MNATRFDDPIPYHARQTPVRDELLAESDRSAAIIACAILEQELGSAIQHMLYIPHVGKAHNTIMGMFKGYGPLATLSSRRDMGLGLGLYGRVTWLDIEKIAQVRNIFAHQAITMWKNDNPPQPPNFESGDVADKCDALKLCDRRIGTRGKAIRFPTPINRKERYINTVLTIHTALIMNSVEDDAEQRNLLP